MSSSFKDRGGLTLIELIVAFTILLILTSMAVPVARFNVRRIHERELRQALEEMRSAIDRYKDMADAGKISALELGVDTYNYPKTLESLVEGVKPANTVAEGKIKFLRRIPMDPMTHSREWGMHSMQDDPKSLGWGSQNLFDVFSKSTEKAADGSSYSDW